MKHIVIAVVFACLASDAYSQVVKPVIVKPGKSFEKCMLLTPPQKIEYSFESAAKLNFALRYQKADRAYYPVKLDRTNGESGMYEAKAKETHCLTWENRTSADIELNFNTKIKS